MGIVITAYIFLFIHIHTCIHENLYRLFPSNVFSSLSFSSFPIPDPTVPVTFPHPCTPVCVPCYKFFPPFDLFPSLLWAVLASVRFSLQEGCRTGPFLVLLNQQNSNWVAKNRAGTLKFISQKVSQAQHPLLLPPLRASTSLYQLSRC